MPDEPTPDSRRKVIVRLTEAQWEALRAYCFHERPTAQKTLLKGLARVIKGFDAEGEPTLCFASK
jgi:DNA-binding MarR family transcriptional regulator